MTMFVLSPSVVTTTASASSMPASRRSWRSIPWPTKKLAGPVVAESPERVLALVDHADVPAGVRSSSATAEPTRPHPTTITFTGQSSRGSRDRAVAENAGRRDS